MEYKFIDQFNSYYIQVINLRINLFFKNFENAIELINDTDENTSKHIVCIDNENVIGTGRLTIRNSIGIISQIAVSKPHQHQGIGKEILNILINECKKQNENKIMLSARETAVSFYKKFKFESVGTIYPSRKTGIPHQNMQLILK